MSKTTLIRLVLWINLSLALHTGTTQAQQVSQAAADLEKMFVDACRERIVGNYEKAVPLLEDLLKKDNKNHAAMYELARVYDAQNKPEQAERLLLSAVALAPGNDWYAKFLADVYQKTGKFLAAASIYELLVKKEPNNENYYFKWAYFLVKADAVDRAIKVYDELEKRIGTNEESVRRKHSLYIGMGNNKKAAEELQRLISTYPKRVEYRHLLASFYDQIGDKAKAQAEYREILRIAPNDAKAALALAGGRGAATDDISYLNSLKPVFENPGGNIDLKIGRILPLVQKAADTRDTALAAALLELTQVLEKAHPGEAKPLAAAGDVLYHSGQKKEALAKYTQALELDKSVFAVWEQLMAIRYEMGNYAALLKVSEDALDYFPNRAMAHFFHAAALLELGKVADAEDFVEQAMLMAGDDKFLRALLLGLKGAMAHARRAYEASDQLFSEALALDPNSSYVLADYSFYLCTRNGIQEKVEAMAQKSARITPGFVRADHALGWAAMKKKDFSAARQYLAGALDNNEEEAPLLLEHYGDLLFQTGDTEGAVKYWSKAQAKGARSSVLERKIAERKWYE